VTVSSQANDTAARQTADPSLGKLVQSASDSISTIVRGELELAKLELRSSVKNAGVGAGLFAAAGVLLAFSLTFALIALAEGLIALGLYRWLGYLIVFVMLLAIIAAFVFIGYRKVKAVRGPEKTIETGRETVGYLKSHPKSVP
jgi:uncharacterized membrane protein YqjE